MITIDYHDDLKEVQGNAALAALFDDARAGAPFDRMGWLCALAQDCAMQPLIAVARRGDGAVMLPLWRNGAAIGALANWYTFRFRPVWSGPRDADLLTALARDLARRTHRLTLAPLPDEDGETATLAAAFRRAGWAVFASQCDVNHVLPVGGRSYAEYLAARPGPLRTTLKRKASRVEIRLFKDFDDDSWKSYEDIYAQSWKPAEGSPAFLRRFAQDEAAAGRLRFGLALAEGQPVAAQFWTVEGGTAWIHKLAHVEAAKPLSPGTTLSAALFEQVIDRDGVGLVDFGTGDDPYKRDWMEAVRPRFRLDMMRPLQPASWPALGRAALSRLAAGANRG